MLLTFSYGLLASFICLVAKVTTNSSLPFVDSFVVVLVVVLAVVVLVVVVTLVVFMVVFAVVKQLSSSEPSGQSTSRSHLQRMLTQKALDWHLNW